MGVERPRSTLRLGPFVSGHKCQLLGSPAHYSFLDLGQYCNRVAKLTVRCATFNHHSHSVRPYGMHSHVSEAQIWAWVSGAVFGLLMPDPLAGMSKFEGRSDLALVLAVDASGSIDDNEFSYSSTALLTHFASARWSGRSGQVQLEQSTSHFSSGEVKSRIQSVRDGFASAPTARRRPSPLMLRHNPVVPMAPLLSAMG